MLGAYAIAAIALPAVVALVVPLLEGRERGARALAAMTIAAFVALVVSALVVPWAGGAFKEQKLLAGLLMYAAVAELVVVYGSDVVLPWPTGAAFQSLALIMLTGLCVTALAEDMLTLISGWILTSIASYATTALAKDRASAEGATKYAVMGSASSTLLFLGVITAFALTGTLDLGKPAGGPLLAVAFSALLFLAAIGFKMGVFPFHGWLPDTYGITYPALIAAVSLVAKALGILALLKVVTLFTQDLGQNWLLVVALLSIPTMLYGNLGALLQDDVQRLLAFSSIAHAGYLLVGIASLAPVPGSVPEWGLMGLLTQYAAYSIAKSGSFLALAVVKEGAGSTSMDALRGLGRRDPLLAGSFAVLLLSLMGMPPLLGFWGKLYLFASVAFSAPWLTAAALLNTAISVAYYARVIKAMYFEEGEGPPLPRSAARTAVAIDAALSALLGLGPAQILAGFCAG